MDVEIAVGHGLYYPQTRRGEIEDEPWQGGDRSGSVAGHPNRAPCRLPVPSPSRADSFERMSRRHGEQVVRIAKTGPSADPQAPGEGCPIGRIPMCHMLYDSYYLL